MNKIIKRILSLLLVFGMFFTISSSVIYAKDISTLPANFEQLSKETKIKILKSLIKELKEKIKIQIKRKITETSKEIEKKKNEALTEKVLEKLLITRYKKGYKEDGYGELKITIDKVDIDDENKISFNFSDKFDYLGLLDSSNRKFKFKIKNNISFNKPKTNNIPEIDLKNIYLDFEELSNNLKIYYYIDTDLDKILDSIFKDDKNQKKIAKIKVEKFLKKYLLLDLDNLEGITKKDKEDFITDIYKNNRKEKNIIKYNKKYHPFILVPTKEKEKINGIETTKYIVKNENNINMVKFFSSIGYADSQYSQKQNEDDIQAQLDKYSLELDDLYKDSSEIKIINDILKDDIDFSMFIWISKDGLPLKLNFKLKVKNLMKIVNKMNKKNIKDEIGKLNIDFNFTRKMYYEQKINIEEPKEYIYMEDLAKSIFNQYSENEIGDSGDNAIIAPEIPSVSEN